MKEQQDPMFDQPIICPVCHNAVPKGGCIHMADEALEIWEARRGLA